MKCLALSNAPARAISQDELRRELRHTWELYCDGSIREMYARADRVGVVFVLECGDVSAAGALLQQFPLVRDGVLTFEVVPLGPLASLEALFGTS